MQKVPSSVSGQSHSESTCWLPCTCRRTVCRLSRWPTTSSARSNRKPGWRFKFAMLSRKLTPWICPRHAPNLGHSCTQQRLKNWQRARPIYNPFLGGDSVQALAALLAATKLKLLMVRPRGVSTAQAKRECVDATACCPANALYRKAVAFQLRACSLMQHVSDVAAAGFHQELLQVQLGCAIVTSGLNPFSSPCAFM